MYSIYADFMRIATRMPEPDPRASDTKLREARRRWKAQAHWKAPFGGH